MARKKLHAGTGDKDAVGGRGSAAQLEHVTAVAAEIVIQTVNRLPVR